MGSSDASIKWCWTHDSGLCADTPVALTCGGIVSTMYNSDLTLQVPHAATDPCFHRNQICINLHLKEARAFNRTKLSALALAQARVSPAS